jgi:uncharacterized membrane protein YqiK
MLFWHVPAPNEALLISGSKRHKDATQFRIVTGHGSFVMPVKQRARILSLALREGNQELIAATKLIENLPAIVEAAARGLAGANLTVLNGTQGVNEIVAGLVGQGMSILDLLKKSGMAPAPAPSANGTTSTALDKIA